MQIYTEIYEILPTEKRIIPGTQNGFFGQNTLFNTVSNEVYIVPSWLKSIVSNTVRYEDILSAILSAKNGSPSNLSEKVLNVYSTNVTRLINTENKLF